MRQKSANVKEKEHIGHKKIVMPAGRSNCLGCGKYLAYCGKPFTAEIACLKCGAINVYEDSQQPKHLKDAA